MSDCGFLNKTARLVSWRPRDTVDRYLCAIGAVLLGFLLRSPVWSLLKTDAPFLTFFPAVMVAAWLGGFGPGLLSTVLSALGVIFFLIRPLQSFGIARGSDAVSVGIFVAVGAFISLVTGKLQSSLAFEEKAREQMRDTLDSIRDGFMALDADWRFTYVNPAAEQLVRKSAAELLGRDHWEEFPESKQTIVEVSYRRALLEQTPVRFKNYYAPLQKWFDVSAFPTKDGGLSVYFQDISELKTNELALRQSEARLRRKNEDLQQFTYSASHDLAEPLRTLITYLQLLERRHSEALDESAAGLIAEAVKGAKRMHEMLDALLDYSQAGESLETLDSVSAQVVLTETLEQLRTAIEETGAVVTTCALPEVRAAAVPLGQVFQNLIANALKYRNAKERPRIHVSAVANGTFCVFSVSDNGVGIDPQDHERIFKLFQRLGECDVEGTGIGLATCKKIVERWDGRIWVESAPGQGATFSFTVPMAQKTEA